ncbi:MAG TPA: hypothetical protein VJ690_00060, partial [Burkholderiales bacterium]|nr:hypothetical protein [Burkholderiales bacterium]
EPERAPRRARAIASVRAGALQALEQAQELEVSADQVSTGRQPFKVIGFERRRLLRGEQRLIRLVPLAPLVVLAGDLQRIGYSGGSAVHGHVALAIIRPGAAARSEFDWAT